MSYPGGKSGPGVYQSIINLMPPHDVYIEPFLGAGAIMRLKKPAAENWGIDLLEMSESALRDRLPAKSAIAADIARNGGNLDPRHFSRVQLEEIRFHLQQGDGIAFLENYKFTGRELVYCDPPYLMETRSGRRLYEHEMSDVDHRRLLRVLLEIKAMVMISGYSSPLYARELKKWNAASFQTTTRGHKPVAEWLWYNYPRPVALHDYRFLGSDFRERERIRRQQKRWKGKLERMDTLQRQALLAAIADTGGFSEGTQQFKA